MVYRVQFGFLLMWWQHPRVTSSPKITCKNSAWPSSAVVLTTGSESSQFIFLLIQISQYIVVKPTFPFGLPTPGILGIPRNVSSALARAEWVEQKKTEGRATDEVNFGSFFGRKHLFLWNQGYSLVFFLKIFENILVLCRTMSHNSLSSTVSLITLIKEITWTQ